MRQAQSARHARGQLLGIEIEHAANSTLRTVLTAFRTFSATCRSRPRDPAFGCRAPMTYGSAMSAANPVNDWTTDYDILDDDYIADPYPVWADLREQCPITHTERWRGS
jgi:hypothetical protein